LFIYIKVLEAGSSNNAQTESFASCAGEIGACVVAGCGIGTSRLLVPLFTELLPMVLFSLQTRTIGHVLAHFIIKSAVYTYANATQLTQSDQSLVDAIKYMFELVCELLERQQHYPGPSLSFPLTYISLSCNVQSIIQHAPTIRLATTLQKIGCSNLILPLLNSNISGVQIFS